MPKIILTKKEILERFGFDPSFEMEIAGEEEVGRDSGVPTTEATGKPNTLKVTFPRMTLKEIFKKSKGKAENGKPLVWNFEKTWVRDEPFFDSEMTCGKECVIDLEITNLGKDWNECYAEARKNGKRMLNMAELVWLYWKHWDTVGPLLEGRYTWLSTRTVDSDLGCSGLWDSGGPLGGRCDARRSISNLGLGFSCIES